MTGRGLDPEGGKGPAAPIGDMKFHCCHLPH